MFDLLNFGDSPTVDSTPTMQPLPKSTADPSRMTVNECDDIEPVVQNLLEVCRNLTVRKVKGVRDRTA